MKRFLYSFSPPTLRLFARRLYFLPLDAYERILAKKNGVIPPRGKILISRGDFIKTGERHLTYFQDLAGLQPHHSVLDAGCGIGRIAMPLTRFLNKKGTYDGFDSVKNEIDWCTKHISPKYPNFRFRFTGSFKKFNNTSHKTNKGNFVFPYDDERFDFVFFNSVFTHIMPAEVEQYLNETGRVMKSGATSLMFFYIVNCESEDLMIKRPTQMNFPYNKGFYRLRSLQSDDKHVAYDEEWLLEKLSNAGLKMESIKYGQWCGRKNYSDYQDLILCRKS